METFDQMKCEFQVTRRNAAGRKVLDEYGKIAYFDCNLPALTYVVKGQLSEAKVKLCHRHYAVIKNGNKFVIQET